MEKKIIVKDHILPQDIRIEDSGMYKYFEIGDDLTPINVQVGSYAYDKDHKIFDNIVGKALAENKKIKITIELED